VGRRSLSIGLSIRLSTWAAPADVHSLVDHHGTGIASAQNNRNADTLAAHLHANDVCRPHCLRAFHRRRSGARL